MANFSSASPDAYLALAIQSAQGTPNTTPAKFRFAKYLSGNSFNVETEVVDVREGGDGLDFGFTYKRGIRVAGQLVAYARPQFLGQLLAFLPGGATYVGTQTGPISEFLFHNSHASFPYGTLQIAHPGTDLIHLFSDVRFTGLTIEAEAGQPLRVTAPWVGMTLGASTGVALVPSYGGESEPFLYHVGPSYLLDGSADSTLESWSIEQTLGTEDLMAQRIMLDDIVVQNRDANFQAVRRYQNSTLWKKIAYAGGVAPSQSVATGAFQSTNQNAASGTTSHRLLKIDLGLLTYRNDGLTELDPDGRTVRETIAAKPLKTATAAMAIRLWAPAAIASGW